MDVGRITALVRECLWVGLGGQGAHRLVPTFASQDEGAKGTPKESDQSTAAGLLRRGQAAARRGELGRAARLFRATLIADPANVEARLWLAAIVEDPQESVQILTEVLQDHPDNARAAAGLRWAWDRLEAQAAAQPLQLGVRQELQPLPAVPRARRVSVARVAAVALCLLVIAAGAFAIGNYSWAQGLWAPDRTMPTQMPVSLPVSEPIMLPVSETEPPPGILQPSPTFPLPTLDATPTELMPTATELPTATLEPTATATATLAPTEPPTIAPSPTKRVVQVVKTPATKKAREGKWIEVNLSTQTCIAWQGQTPVRRMVISSGVAPYYTVTGSYRIYVKLTSTVMSGPGYYLPGVPHTMYFYRGYALHGAYWHNNFGTPMSHGCVNLRLADAAWLFNWADPQMPAGSHVVYASASNPGTLVVIHY